MSQQVTGSQAAVKAQELMRELDVCMLTTCSSSGRLHSRPMSTNGLVDLDGTIWFFSTDDSLKALEINAFPRVNLSFADKDQNIYVSVSGVATVVKDRHKIQELWKPALKAWFHEGPEQENLALIKITSEKTEYWDIPGNVISHLFGLGKALVTGGSYEPGQHGIVQNSPS